MSVIDEEVKRMLDDLEQMDKAIVKTALFGQPGAGKSSLINKIVGKKVADYGIETDKTIEIGWHESNGLMFADLPGYGTKNFPKESYFQRFDIEQFDLFLCVTSGKFHQADTEFFRELKKRGKVCIFIVNKHDELWEEDVTIEELEKRKRDDITKQVGQRVKVIFTSCRKNTGLDELNQEIRNNLNGAKRERWERSAKAYSIKFLEEKRATCEKYVARAAKAALLNGVNPVPGTDIVIDLAIILKLFSSIRDAYGLNDSSLAQLEISTIPVVVQTANFVTRFATKEGALKLLQNYAKAETTKMIAKYVPFVGQAIAASIGYLVTSNAGENYLEKCHQLAEQILTHNLKV